VYRLFVEAQFRNRKAILVSLGLTSAAVVTAPPYQNVHVTVGNNVLAAALAMSLLYMAMTSIGGGRMLDRELKKGSAELIILSIVEPRARHGYEIGKLIELRSGGRLKFHVASLYPLLYRLEERGWLQGRWLEKPGERRRRFYSLTAEGRRVLGRQRETWKTFVSAMALITGDDHG
jgi:PadR family transcriptional regulator PadR